MQCHNRSCTRRSSISPHIRTNPTHSEGGHMSGISTTEKLIARKENGIGWVIFNQPERRNAMTPEMVDSMRLALESYATDPDVRVVILKGEGDKAFVSGADISKFAETRSNAEQVRVAEARSEAANRA